MANVNMPMSGQSHAVPVSQGSEEYNKDVLGYTTPNLHRYLDDTLDDNEYQLHISSIYSYRGVFTSTHDEESETCEIP